MGVLEPGDVTKPWTLVASVVAVSVAYFVGSIVYRLYFHPLHHIPGPWINAVSRVPYIRHLLAGTTVVNVSELHAKYGEVVRISPNEISFTSGDTAWQDIYGFRTGKHKGHLSMLKDPAWYAQPPGSAHIICSSNEDHSRFRKVLSHSFSDKALANQETLLQGYVDLLINQLKDVTSKDKSPQDLTQWYNWTTFDVMADLLFGEPFGSLQELATSKYIHMLFDSFTAFKYWYIMYYWPWTKRLRNWILDQRVIQNRLTYYKFVASQTQKRAQRETQRPDLMTTILQHNGEKGAVISATEMNNNNSVMLTAGSETTATLLSGVTYLLLKNPEVLAKLMKDVRGRWKKYDDITLESVNNTPYLIAVLQEGLRYFPPVPAGFERRVGKGGEVVSGYFIPENTALSVSSYPTGHSERNFKDPEAFVPERWMGDPRYADDKKSSINPFSFGPRNCLGKNLAYAEMRLILAKMIWSFDLELDPKSDDWMKRCKVNTLWEKPELAVRVKEVVRE
ncbi:uncharacterized protein LTR77_000110 [Saxophila tyrrhenica]|uniref:Cytochrome P450 monooxygenase n=1 Tax=Saxophila tyrrhenica TaxID=1690608 RepID=A0AAV9PM34_9PEZI|nr:hypothetical protein LTR77_000110 [Saxophila tyrrhenica]